MIRRNLMRYAPARRTSTLLQTSSLPLATTTSNTSLPPRTVITHSSHKKEESDVQQQQSVLGSASSSGSAAAHEGPMLSLLKNKGEGGNRTAAQMTIVSEEDMLVRLQQEKITAEYNEMVDDIENRRRQGAVAKFSSSSGGEGIAKRENRKKNRRVPLVGGVRHQLPAASRNNPNNPVNEKSAEIDLEEQLDDDEKTAGLSPSELEVIPQGGEAITTEMARAKSAYRTAVLAKQKLLPDLFGDLTRKTSADRELAMTTVPMDSTKEERKAVQTRFKEKSTWQQLLDAPVPKDLNLREALLEAVQLVHVKSLSELDGTKAVASSSSSPAAATTSPRKERKEVAGKNQVVNSSDLRPAAKLFNLLSDFQLGNASEGEEETVKVTDGSSSEEEATVQKKDEPITLEQITEFVRVTADALFDPVITSYRQQWLLGSSSSSTLLREDLKGNTSGCTTTAVNTTTTKDLLLDALIHRVSLSEMSTRHQEARLTELKYIDSLTDKDESVALVSDFLYQCATMVEEGEQHCSPTTTSTSTAPSSPRAPPSRVVAATSEGKDASMILTSLLKISGLLNHKVNMLRRQKTVLSLGGQPLGVQLSPTVQLVAVEESDDRLVVVTPPSTMQSGGTTGSERELHPSQFLSGDDKDFHLNAFFQMLATQYTFFCSRKLGGPNASHSGLLKQPPLSHPTSVLSYTLPNIYGAQMHPKTKELHLYLLRLAESPGSKRREEEKDAHHSAAMCRILHEVCDGRWNGGAESERPGAYSPLFEFVCISPSETQGFGFQSQSDRSELLRELESLRTTMRQSQLTGDA